jgi:glycolate dehydrogenase FAD-binding subunit
VSTVSAATGLASELCAISGAEHVVEDPSRLQDHQVLGVTPAAAVTPASADEIVAIVRFANQHALTVVPAGGFTQQHIGNFLPQVDILLYTTRLCELEHYDPGDLTIGIGAGWTVARLAAKVGEDGLFFAGDSALPERCTIGGLLATGFYGPHRHGYGGLRDFCIGIKFVTGDARKGKGGGRVVKNVAGYDMMKLLIGSQGTLGIITGASFKLFPAPRQTRTLVAGFSTAAEALEFRRHVLRSPLDPICLELVSPEAHKLLAPESPAGALWSICLRAAGSDTVLARYRAELGSAVVREIEGADGRGFWRALADFSPIAREHYPNSLLISLTMPLRDVQPVLSDLVTIAELGGFIPAAVGRVGVGHLLAALWPALDAEGATANYLDAVSALRKCLPRGVSMAVLHCPYEVRQKINVWGPTPTNHDSIKTTKMALDPHDILNRGRFLA